MRSRPTSLLLALIMIGIGFVPLPAQDRAIIERMQERLPVVDALLQQGLVGENNRGLLASRGELNDEQQDVVEAENEDRVTVYRLVAERTGQSVEEVAKQRALQIRQRAARGIWLQAVDGRWYQKE